MGLFWFYFLSKREFDVGRFALIMLQWIQERERGRRRESSFTFDGYSGVLSSVSCYWLSFRDSTTCSLIKPISLSIIFSTFGASCCCELPCKFWDLGSRVWAFDFLSPWVSFHLLLLSLSFFLRKLVLKSILGFPQKKKDSIYVFVGFRVRWWAELFVFLKQKSHVSQIRLLGVVGSLKIQDSLSFVGEGVEAEFVIDWCDGLK